MNTHISKEKKRLIRSFHATLAKGGMMKQKPDILESFGVEHTYELSEEELQHVIDNLTGEADRWRKRVIAAVFAWCKAINLDYNTNQVKAVASRAAGYKELNEIPVSRLRDVYYEFVRKSRTTVAARNTKEELVNYLENRN